ncbi:MAG: hypothetical protein QM706_18050 [Nitrospira sp.]
MSKDKSNHSLTFAAKLQLALCGMVVVTGTAIIFVADQNARSTTRTLTESLFREVSINAADKTTDFIQRTRPLPNL